MHQVERLANKLPTILRLYSIMVLTHQERWLWLVVQLVKSMHKTLNWRKQANNSFKRDTNSSPLNAILQTKLIKTNYLSRQIIFLILRPNGQIVECALRARTETVMDFTHVHCYVRWNHTHLGKIARFQWVLLTCVFQILFLNVKYSLMQPTAMESYFLLVCTFLPLGLDTGNRRKCNSLPRSPLVLWSQFSASVAKHSRPWTDSQPVSQQAGRMQQGCEVLLMCYVCNQQQGDFKKQLVAVCNEEEKDLGKSARSWSSWLYDWKISHRNTMLCHTLCLLCSQNAGLLLQK